MGNVVAADVRLVDGDVLLDQSMLTGESLPVEGAAGSQTYAGALVRRGEALAEVTATGVRTKFGKTAELVRTAQVVSSQQKAVLRVVRNLSIFNAAIVLIQVIYALFLGMSVKEIILLTLTSILAAIPVALPAAFTLATAFSARALARQGVLPTRLSAVDEAATIDILCADKTGTLTQNELAVVAAQPFSGFDISHLFMLASLASSEEARIRWIMLSGSLLRASPLAIHRISSSSCPSIRQTKWRRPQCATLTATRYASSKVPSVPLRRLAKVPPIAADAADKLEAQGYRVLAVGSGPATDMQLIGLIALSDLPRPDSASLVAQLHALSVTTVMVTGDAATTASSVARAVGLEGSTCPEGLIPDHIRPEEFAIFAGVLPETNTRSCRPFRKPGIPSACAVTAPMTRQRFARHKWELRYRPQPMLPNRPQDCADGTRARWRSCSRREGRVTFQRILTYTLRSITRKFDQMLFLTVGLMMTGHAILTPMLMVILMATGDFLAMSSSTTDNVRPSSKPNAWRINNLTITGIVLGFCNLLFCSTILAVGKFYLHLSIDALRTLTAVTLVCTGQAVFYVVRERRHIWSSRPGAWLVVSSIVDVTIIAVLATQGILMTRLPVFLPVAIFCAAVLFAFVLDDVKVRLSARLELV